jgi:DNA repair exonuclease SbcCD ATPase subunit
MAGKRSAAKDPLTDAVRRLYAAPPENFTATRTGLAKELRSAGEEDAADQLAKLRKPTAAAAIVNGLVLADESVVERLRELGDRLREAQQRLDAAELRDLTGERRRLVDELTRAALARAEKPSTTTALRDEVTGTFDAALADPEVADRLGRLQRAEHWSGFGFAGATPNLTVVRGGSAPGKRPSAKAAPAKSAADRRKEQKALADARRAHEAAEAAFAEAQSAERELARRVETLTRRLAKVQADLEEARGALEDARHASTAAKVQRRDARSALDRAERAVSE